MSITRRTLTCIHSVLLGFACASTVLAAETGASPAISMVVVAHNALASFLVDISAHVFRFDDCDVYFHDEKEWHGLHVA